jgi:hypothetical protein
MLSWRTIGNGDIESVRSGTRAGRWMLGALWDAAGSKPPQGQAQAVIGRGAATARAEPGARCRYGGAAAAG